MTLETRLAAAEARQAEIARRQEMIIEAEKRKPTVIDLDAIRKASAKHAKPKAETAATEGSVYLPRRSDIYIDGIGRVYQRGEWTEPDQKWWDHRTRYGPAGRVLHVGDIGGSTTVEVGGATWIRRGCLIDGNPEIVQDKVSIGKWKAGPWRGGLCVDCHKWFTSEISIAAKNDRDALGQFVTARLQAEGYIDRQAKLSVEVRVSSAHTNVKEFFVRDWVDKTWAARVLRAEHPERQAPPRKPFGYLSGRLRVAEPEASA